MKQNSLLDQIRRVLSILLNLAVVRMEPIAIRMSWEAVGEQSLTFYTENSNLFSAAVCLLVCLLAGCGSKEQTVTPDFVLTYADGTVEVVEVKSKFTRRQQRAVNIQKNQLTTHTFILYHQREPRSTI